MSHHTKTLGVVPHTIKRLGAYLHAKHISFRLMNTIYRENRKLQYMLSLNGKRYKLTFRYSSENDKHVILPIIPLWLDTPYRYCNAFNLSANEYRHGVRKYIHYAMDRGKLWE